MDTSIVTENYKFACIDCGAEVSEKRATRCRTCFSANRSNKEIEYHDLAKVRGILWVGELPGRNKEPTTWRCTRGHEWMASYACISKSKNCPLCPMVKEEDYHALAQKRGFLWVGKHPHKTRIPTEWQCPKGHRWMARYNTIRQNSGCPHCNKIANHVKVEDYTALAVERGFTWIGTFPKDTRVKTEWVCVNGHHWMGTYHSIRNGRGCPQCRKVQESDYNDLASRRGYIWIGNKPQTVTQKTEWQCSNGHKWFSEYRSIYDGKGCPHCSKIEDRHSDEDYHAVAKKRGFLWIGELPNGVDLPTLWQCTKGHQWLTTYNGIKAGYSCPDCDFRVNGVKNSKPQQAIFEMVGGVLNYRIGRYAIDIALQLPTTNLAVEYDSWYYHGKHADRDARKTEKLLALGWKVLRIKAGAMLPTFDQIQDAIFKLLAGSDYEEIVLPDWGKGNAKVYK